MSALCYPYGGGITCVCDEVGKIFKCFPDLGVEQAGQKTQWGPDYNSGAEQSLLNINFFDGR